MRLILQSTADSFTYFLHTVQHRIRIVPETSVFLKSLYTVDIGKKQDKNPVV